MAYADTIRTSNADLEDVADLLDGLYTYITNLDQGWTLLTDTMTYASATTITVPTGAASRYQKGDKLKFTNSTTKYMYITGVADTVLTVYGGIDYVVANTTISTAYVSRAEQPFGFPVKFNWTPTYGTQAGSYGSTSTNWAYFTVQNGWVHIQWSFSGTLSSASTDYLTFTLPIAFPNIGASMAVPYFGADDGVYSDGSIMLYTNNSATVRFYRNEDLGTTDITTGVCGSEGVSRYAWA